jgi:hypothetical protein
MRPGISFSASSISRRPKAAKLISATLNLEAGADIVEVDFEIEVGFLLLMLLLMV